MKKKIFYTSILLIMALLSAKSTSAWRAKQELKPIDKLEASVGQDGSVTLSWSAPESKTKTILILEEGFEEGIPFGWDTIDADKDGYHWKIMEVPTGHNSHNCISSASYIPNEGALTPDNYLITPALQLEKEATLSFWISSHNAAYPEEKWAVYASSEGASAEDFKEALLEGTLTAKSMKPANKNASRQGEWYHKEVSLPAGTKYVAFRHFDCSDLFAIGLDDIKIETAADEPQVSSYTIYRGEAEIASAVTETTFTEQNAPVGEHKYCVVANYGVAGSSEAVCTSVSIEELVEPSYDPVTELTASYDATNKKISLSWKSPSRRNSEILYEGFENEIPAEWTIVDADGDYYEWKHTTLDAYESQGCATSTSYIFSEGALSPDNYLITPQLDINEDAVLTYWVAAHSNSELPAEKYGVFISSTGSQPADFSEAFSETMSRYGETRRADRDTEAHSATCRSSWKQQRVKITKGTKHIAFRHFDCSGGYWLYIDEVKVFTEENGEENEEETPEELSYNIYRNGKLLKNVSTESYEEEFSEPGTYTYEVEVKYASGLSPKVAVELEIPIGELGDGNARIILEARNAWIDGSGYIMLMDKSASLFGSSIPQQGPLVNGCQVPEGLQEEFSHIIPRSGQISCNPAADQWVTDGEAILDIPAGIYDYCIINPQPYNKIWIAAGENGRKDNFAIEAGKEYRFRAKLLGGGDAIDIETKILNSLETVASNLKAYGTKGKIVIEAEQPIRVDIYELHGRRIATKEVSGKAEIPCQAGIYIVQLGKEQSQKVLVN